MKLLAKIWPGLALAAWLGLMPQPAFAATGLIRLEVGGLKRTALVVEHERLKKARRPLVFVLHGNGGDGARIRRNLGLDALFDETGTVLVFPDAYEKHWAVDGARHAKIDDAAFIRALAARLVAQGIGDPHRIFVTGVSTGGMMALRMGCEHADMIAGVAVINANLPADLAASCKPVRPVPLLLINGTADPRMPYQGGQTQTLDVEGPVASTDATLAPFATVAGCTGARISTPYASRSAKSGTRAIRERYPACKTQVRLVRIEGGGHTIPGAGHWNGADSGAAVGAHNVDIDAARLIFRFFKKFKGA